VPLFPKRQSCDRTLDPQLLQAQRDRAQRAADGKDRRARGRPRRVSAGSARIRVVCKPIAPIRESSPNRAPESAKAAESKLPARAGISGASRVARPSTPGASPPRGTCPAGSAARTATPLARPRSTQGSVALSLRTAAYPF
jgi:hypothetical protein